MIADIFNAVLYQPLYNGLVFLISTISFGDVGIAIVLLTLFVRSVLLPLTHKSTKTQARLRELEPELKGIKEKFKDKKEEQSKRLMEIYRQHGINPFSGCLLFVVQIPVLIALFWVILKGLANGVDMDSVYSFIPSPGTPSFNFLGLINIAERSFILSLLAGATQFLQMKLSMPPGMDKKKLPEGGKLSFKDEFARNFGIQMRYGLPVFVFIITFFTFPSAVALYWTTSNLFSVGHELLVKRKALNFKGSPRGEATPGDAEIVPQEKA